MLYAFLTGPGFLLLIWGREVRADQMSSAACIGMAALALRTVGFVPGAMGLFGHRHAKRALLSWSALVSLYVLGDLAFSFVWLGIIALARVGCVLPLFGGWPLLCLCVVGVLSRR